MMALDQLKTTVPGATAETWHQHTNPDGRLGGWADNLASIGERASIGEGASIGEWASIGEGASIGKGASIGEWARIGERASIGEGARIGERASIGERAREAIDLGSYEGYRKAIAQIDGVAYIGAGCHWFTLEDAKKHWAGRAADRPITQAMLVMASEIARLKGWRESAGGGQ